MSLIATLWEQGIYVEESPTTHYFVEPKDPRAHLILTLGHRSESCSDGLRRRDHYVILTVLRLR